MSFLLPGFFAACALIGLPFFLHLLRIEPKNVVPFPSLRFLGREALRDSRRHQITRWLLLLLRCLLIALVAIAFARPFWPFAHSFEDRSVVVVVDASASMQAKGRREAVEAWLTPQLDALRPPDRLGVLMLAPDPVWLVPLSRDLDSARDALRSLPQGFASVHYRTSLDLAGAVLAASPSRRKQILLAGDQQTLSWENARFERALPPGVDLLVAPTAPAPQRQAAVVAFRAERVDEGHLMVEAAVRGYAPAEDERSVRFFAGETLLGKQRFPLAAGQTHLSGVQSRLRPALASQSRSGRPDGRRHRLCRSSSRRWSLRDALIRDLEFRLRFSLGRAKISTRSQARIPSDRSPADRRAMANRVGRHSSRARTLPGRVGFGLGRLRRPRRLRLDSV